MFNFLKRKNYAKDHPEAQEGEVFLTNADEKTFDEHIRWKTKRKGNVAYDTRNQPLGHRWNGSFPVFVQREELEEKGIDPDKLH